MTKNSLVLYKNQPAVVKDRDGDKYIIQFCTQAASSGGKKPVYSEQKVREKDVILLHEGPVSGIEKILENASIDFSKEIKEVYELLISDESIVKEGVSLSDLSEYALGKFEGDLCWAFYSSLVKTSEFSLNQDELKNSRIVFNLRTKEEIALLNQKKFEKEHEAEIKNEFINRLKNKKLELPLDSKFMGEVEAFALNKTEKSKILEEAGLPQSIEKAHQLLIDTGIWDYTKNPYPTRFGFSFDSAHEQLGKMKDEQREVVPCVCYAIDSPDASDPDDAVGYDGEWLWVCIADPASTVMPDSSIDIAARNRGTTLYIPEGASRMLCESSLEDYALGLKEKHSGNKDDIKSCALAFKIKLDDESQISEVDIKKVLVHVKMISYAQAEEQKDSAELKPLFEIARRNLKRRNQNNAVTIQMPEVKIKVDKETKKVTVEPEQRYESNDMIQEMMLLAGEGAAKFAFKNKIPFPFVSQEAPSFPDKIPEGWAGEFARVKCMRKRSVGITPAPHAGLGLSFYSQVTSPLRRYSDLIAHQQLRAFIDKRKLIDKDEMLERIAAGDAASIAARKAARLSETHWKLVYLIQNPDKIYDAFCIDKKGNDTLFLIPSLDMQTTLKSCQDISLNDKINVKAGAVNIPLQNVNFIRT
ncbi:MAG: RNB domain-containing ribonuclease [Treponema sp.]|nr:RNB domain-containing ribonuclease [Treponema sp.]